jgi:hypothetical protein
MRLRLGITTNHEPRQCQNRSGEIEGGLPNPGDGGIDEVTRCNSQDQTKKGELDTVQTQAELPQDGDTGEKEERYETDDIENVIQERRILGRDDQGEKPDEDNRDDGERP